jgi:RHS repeat-associated protein
LDDGSIQLQQYEYNEIGMMTKAIDPSGRETLFEYHGNGHDLHLVKQKNGAVYDILAEYTGYNAQHLPQIITDAAGRTTSHTYTAQGQILTTSRSRLVAGVNTTELMTYVYGTTQGASDYQRLKEVRGPGNVLLQSMTYDSAGRVESSTDSSNFTVTYAYDAMDRVTKVTYPDKTTQETYYRHLDPEWIKDRQGRWTQQFYDPLRRLTGVLDPENRFTEYKYCICGALESIIDAKGQETSFIRDIQSRVVQKIFPDGKLLQYEYEATTSRLKWTRDAKGQYTNYRYLIDNNLERVAYTNAPYSDAANPGAGITLERTQPGGPVVDSPVTYTYETSYNRVATMTDWTGPTSYGYYPVNTTDVGGDGLPIFGDGRLATVNGPLANDTITHTYDEYGRELGCDIAGATDGRTFDSLGQLKTTSNPLGTFNHFYIGASGRLDFTLLPNGVKADYDYHGAGQLGSGGNGDFRLKQIQNTLPGGGVISQQDYTFQPAGNIVTWKQAHNGAGGAAVTYSFGYDNADQLLGATQRNDATSGVVAEHGYRYDVAGNRLTEQSGSVVTTSSYNELNQLTARSGGGPMVIEGTVSEPASVAINGTPAKVTGNTFRGTTNVSAGQASVPITATDLQGNTTSKTLQFGTPVVGGAAATYSYDANGNLTGDGARSYEWDAANRLIAINYLPNNGRTEFGYNGRGQRVREIEKTSTGGYLSVKLLVWCGTELREQRDGGNIVVKRFYREGEQVVSGGNVGSYYYTRDHLGSVRELLDGHAAVRGRSGYDPYGRKTTTGQAVHQSSNVGGMHQHYFYNSSQTLAVNSGDKLVAYVWIDPASPPSEIMLQWCSAEEGFNHRAYWGANLLGWGTDGHYSRSYRGALPAAGQWVRLEVPASQLGLEGKTLHGMAFSLFNGTARWDHAGKRGATNVDTAWVDDAVPAGAVLAGDNDSWNWSTSGWAPQADKAYTGHYYHDRSALHLAYYRAYSAEVGRWLSRDPLSRAELREGPNLYRYVRNRPSIFGDLLGLKCPCGENLTAASALGLADATRASILASEAIREAQNAASRLPGGLAGINNGAADAFRHCLWSCKMAQNLDDGARDAKAMGDIHEACGSNPPAEQAMDQHNNAVGRSLFNPGVDCSSACMQAATDGTLQTSVGGTPPANNY